MVATDERTEGAIGVVIDEARTVVEEEIEDVAVETFEEGVDDDNRSLLVVVVVKDILCSSSTAVGCRLHSQMSTFLSSAVYLNLQHHCWKVGRQPSVLDARVLAL